MSSLQITISKESDKNELIVDDEGEIYFIDVCGIMNSLIDSIVTNQDIDQQIIISAHLKEPIDKSRTNYIEKRNQIYNNMIEASKDIIKLYNKLDEIESEYHMQQVE
jgi:hypothetical protein